VDREAESREEEVAGRKRNMRKKLEDSVEENEQHRVFSQDTVGERYLVRLPQR
jgi:hypothetical protein